MDRLLYHDSSYALEKETRELKEMFKGLRQNYLDLQAEVKRTQKAPEERAKEAADNALLEIMGGH